MITKWVKLCSVGKDFRPTDGDTAAVANAVRQGADLRRFSTYSPKLTGLVEETMTLQTTWVFDNEHVGGLATLRQPINCGLDFFNGPCIAYYIFHVAAPTCMAFVPLDGSPMDKATGNWVRVDNHSFDGDKAEWLSERYHWWGRNEWEEICAHDEDGNPSLGSWEEVHRAANDGCTLKVGIRNLWNHFTTPGETPLEHEVFIECSVQFAHVDAHFFGALTVPTFLVRPCTPMKFSNEDFAPGWLLVRTDGRIQHQTLDPSTLKWERTWTRHAIRWFAR